ncbi:hypothetical protein RFI_37942, partial [Reticulomyxa filosa]
MIAISEYEDNKKWRNLESAKDDDINNFKYIFEQELNYEFVCNEEPKMNKDDVNEFLATLIVNHKNKKQYDALIIIISGHGNEGEEQNNIHNDNGFLMIWSTTKGYQ